MGQQRTALLTCMTCADTARRWRTWEDDPLQAMQREIEWESGRGYGRRKDRGFRTHDELIAIAALIDAHREEFEARIAESEQRREWVERKASLKTNRKPTYA